MIAGYLAGLRVMRRGARFLAALALGPVLVVSSAGPASAHTIGGVAPTDYRSQVVSVAPPTPGLSVRLLDLGRRVEVANTGSEEILVLGYAGEPYLRVGPRGVFENQRSPSHFRNRLLVPGSPTTTLPPTADAAAPPQWRRLSGGHVARWRDQRTRWEGADPPSVRRARGAGPVPVSRWTLELRQGEAPIVVTGTITWEPGPAVLPWGLLALALAAATVGLALLPHWGRTLSGCLALLVAVTVVTSFAGAAAGRSSFPVQLVQVLLGGFVLTIGWVIAVVAMGPLQEQREGAVVAAGGAGLIMAVMSGIADLSVLVRSQVPSTLPPQLARLGVVIAVGVGLGLVGAAGTILRRHAARPAPAPPPVGSPVRPPEG